ncbi:Regulator of sigma D [Vibrio aerogenes CECT 7868]|uniref:Regulator of sigma D n=1 Tax=Vibrio aerogenes CECT 7868 TaxID=1216006 RepID=A0A1M5YTS9_9VIBR|nr:Rsd/AlgQ family anti-sigma factor [Vibrio aerogenes]SHI15214.1 Regulator of sigma D [Vibrio aerogenes CECT 7868]
MLNKFKRTQEQWGGSNEVIDHWLDTRQSLLVKYCRLVTKQPNSTRNTISELPTIHEIHSFCRRLVDYISTGHFKIYDTVKAKWESTGFTATDDINRTYIAIVETTDPLLNFADKYLDMKDGDQLENFDLELSELGEVLEVRFEVEDQLIQLIVDSLSIPPGA